MLSFILLATCVGVAVSSSSDCLSVCPANYDPVCGTDGTTYSNQCMLQTVTCRNSAITLAHTGACPGPSTTRRPGIGCLRACQHIYDPVCGSDGHTYNNECVMQSAACRLGSAITVQSRGRCRPLCMRRCPRNYSPVCGSDGNTYNNECLMEIVSCWRAEALEVAHTGPCE